MGMYNLIEDNVNEVYTIVEKTVGECETVSELENKMQEHEHLLQGSSDEEYKDELYCELWQEFWSKFN